MASMLIHWWRAYRGRTTHAWVQRAAGWIALCEPTLRYTSQLWKDSFKRCQKCLRLSSEERYPQ